MDKDLYQHYFDHEETHWWFVARRQIIKNILDIYVPNKDSGSNAILEIGTGTGGNLKMLSKFGKIFGMEMDQTACEIAKSRRICDVKQGKLPDKLPFDMNFDLICMFDVLEHIEKDVETLNSIKMKLTNRGKIVLTVPAYQWLWSHHDVVNHHYRRYNQKTLQKVISDAGLTVTYISYFNTWLMPIIASIRLIKNSLRLKGDSDLSEPNKYINKWLMHIFASERFLMPKLKFPFGVSLIVVIKNNQQNQ